MRELSPGLWVVETPFRMYAFNLPAFGLEVGRRMTICRIDNGGLWVHSPAELTPTQRGSLEALGQPRFVIAPNAFHGHRFMQQYRDAWPQVELLGGPGLDRRRRDLSFDGLLGSVPDPRWSEQLDQDAFTGHLMPEVVFLHRASRSLIVGDLVAGPFPTDTMTVPSRTVWRLEGASKSSCWVIRHRRLATLNPRTARRSLERILAWDFERIITGHGELIERDGRAALEQAMSWLRTG